jgi:hypothetical protein
MLGRWVLFGVFTPIALLSAKALLLLVDIGGGTLCRGAATDTSVDFYSALCRTSYACLTAALATLVFVGAVVLLAPAAKRTLGALSTVAIAFAAGIELSFANGIGAPLASIAVGALVTIFGSRVIWLLPNPSLERP